jgi:glycosyltransferase involved in cell wall biosynthesis
VNDVAVLHATQPTHGGVARYVAAAAADQLSRGWRVVVACPAGGRLATELRAAGVAWLHWPATRSPGPATVGQVRRLRHLIKQVRPDVVHLHSAKAGLAGRLAVRGSLPTIFQPHGWSWLAARGATARAALAWERHATRWTTVLVCVGEGEAAQARRWRVNIPPVTIRNGIDLECFTPPGRAQRAAARSRLGLDQAVPLAVCLGRITRQKGQDVLLAAWPQVRQGCPAAQLCLVGGGDGAVKLRRRPPPGVRFVPPVTDPRPWYAAADVVVLPSRWEGLSLTLLEALASGCCVVIADIPGLAEAVPTGAGGRFRVADPDALASALLPRLTNPQLRLAEGHQAARAARAFDVRRTHEHLAQVTAQLAGAPACPRRPVP